jgi:hypothetical protein
VFSHPILMFIIVKQTSEAGGRVRGVYTKGIHLYTIFIRSYKIYKNTILYLGDSLVGYLCKAQMSFDIFPPV